MPHVAKALSPETASAARPFIKWAGGKRQLLPDLLKYVPARYGTYHEPFLGGGALFWELSPPRAVLSDTNERLVRAYNGIRNSVEEVIGELSTYPYSKDFFLDLRKKPIDARGDVEVASWLIYLNKTGFNGLYRVNSRNVFNVPFGDNVDKTICDAPNLRACAAALARADVHHSDFRAVAQRAAQGDFVYFDPPYVPLSATSFFTSYTAGGFDMKDQIALCDLARDLKSRGVHVLLSNSSAPAVRELYRDDFEIIEVQATRLVNSKAAGRGKITELLMK